MGFLGKTRNSSPTKAVQPMSQANALPLQTKLEISEPSHPAEREADTIARKVKDEHLQKKQAPESAQPKVQSKGVHRHPNNEKSKLSRAVESHDKKVIKKEDSNTEKKPVQLEKETNFYPKKIQKKEEAKADKPLIHKKPDEKKVVHRMEQRGGAAKDHPDAAHLKVMEQRILAKLGTGMKLPAQVMAKMESSFAEDFSRVTIHTDKEAAELCTELSAHAFAYGNDIFFNTGRFDPESDTGIELLAHELTHVVQQKNAVQRAAKPGATSTPPPSAKVVGTVAGDLVTISSPKLTLPKFKEKHKSKYEAPTSRKNYNRDDVTGEKGQKSIWRGAVRAGVKAKVNDMIKASAANKVGDVYYFKTKKGFLLFGTESTIADNSLIPQWNGYDGATKTVSEPQPAAFDVDHMLELQLEGGENKDNNLELLNFSANRGSGSVIKGEINRMVLSFLQNPANPKLPAMTVHNTLPDQESVDNAMANYRFRFPDPAFTNNTGALAKGQEYWPMDQIIAGLHLSLFKPAKNASEIANQKEPTAYTSKAGGQGITKTSGLPGIEGVSIIIDKETNPVGVLSGALALRDKSVRPLPLKVPLYKIAGVKNAGYISRRGRSDKSNDAKGDKSDESKEENLTSLEDVLKNIDVKGMSPASVDSVDLVPGKGLMINGRIQTSIELFKGLYVDYAIQGDQLELSRTFSSGDIKSIPSPFKVSDASVTVFGGTKGLGVRGNIDFGIDRVGQGSIKANADTAGVFALTGGFDFDPKLLGGAKAHVEANYEHVENGKDKWDINGNIHIPSGKIAGIETADINVSYADRIFKAEGNAKFNIPGLQDGKLAIVYTGDNISIEGEANFRHTLIKEGHVKARLDQSGDKTSLAIDGKATPAIPGVDSELSVLYTNGVLTVSGTADYAKGRLSGSVQVGVTNQQTGADGKPAGTPGKSLHAFGGGTLGIKITDWLKGSATVVLRPDGSLDVTGKIGIPETVDIFPRKEINTEIFKAPTIEIPIFAIPLGSRSIGLVATIGGGLDAYAGIGPGQLTKAEVEVKYNPSHEENTSVTGVARFRVPADAGLKVYVRAGIGASVAIARVAGGLEIAGALGIEGAAEAAVQVNWTPRQGFKLDAEAALSVQPKFKFDVNAYIEAVLDLWVKEFRKDWKWNLTSFEWGPAMRFGVRFPVHYEENKPFSIKLDDVVFEKPDVSVKDIAKGIGQKIME